MSIPQFDTARRDERLAFFADRMDREGWDDTARAAHARLQAHVESFAPGTLVVPSQDDAELDDRLVALGSLTADWDGIRMTPGRHRECHGNVSRKWLKQKNGRLRIATGYAVSGDGLWRRHSWMVDDAGRVTETTLPRLAYFGVVLDRDEADAFAHRNA